MKEIHLEGLRVLAKPEASAGRYCAQGGKTRLCDITQEEGVALSEFPVALKQFEQPLTTRESFFDLADRSRSPRVWRRDLDGWWLRHVVWDESGEDT